MLKAIIVDDENYIRKGIKIMIDWQGEGISIVGEASNGKQAIDLIEAHNPDIVLLDIKMPVMDGLSLIEYIRNTMCLHTHVIVLSGYADFTFAQKAMQFNVKQYILKPIEENELLKALKDVKEEIKSDNNLKYKTQISFQSRKSMIIREALSGKISLSSENSNGVIFNVQKGSDYLCLIIHMKKKWYPSYRNLNSYQKQSKSEIEIFTNIIHKADISDLVDLFEYNGGWCLLIDYNQMQKKGLFLNELLSNLKKILIDDYSSHFHLFIGEIIDNFPNDLKRAYETAYESMKLSFYQYNKIIYKYEEIENNAILRSYEEEVFPSDILGLIINSNIVETKKKMENVFEQLCIKKIDPEVIKIRLNYLVHKIVDSISEIDGAYDRNLEKYLVYNVNYSEINVDELKEIVITFCTNAALYIKNLKKISRDGVAYQVKIYIDSHFSEDITLTKLADKFYMNTVYLGQVFKKTYKIKFNDYINQVRINEAKKLLKLTELKAYEVSDKVGYKKPEYFSRKFEEIVGLSPSEYRGDNELASSPFEY